MAPCLSLFSPLFAMRRSPVRSRSRPPNYFALRKPDAPSGFRRYETGIVGLYSREFRKAWDSRAVGRRFHSEAQRKRSPPQPFSIPASRTLDDWCTPGSFLFRENEPGFDGQYGPGPKFRGHLPKRDYRQDTAPRSEANVFNNNPAPIIASTAAAIL